MSDILFEIKEQGGIKLKKLREQTGLDQAAFAGLLGISQSRVSKLEKSEGAETIKAGFEVLVNWCEKAESHKKGVSIDFDGKVPRTEITFRHNAITQAIRNSFPEERSEEAFSVLKKEHAKRGLMAVKNASRKPVLACLGNFDQGKSSVINAIMGRQVMPERMSPTSKLCTLSRDVNERPVWHPEAGTCYKHEVDGLIFNFSYIGDKNYHDKFKVISGDKKYIRNLSDHDYHTGQEECHTERHAVLYVDSPLTTGVDIIDTPGFDNDDVDDETATLSSIRPDITVFCSLASGFMSAGQILRFRMALKNTSHDLADDNPLSNIFILMTNAGSAGGRNATAEEGIEIIRQKAAERIYSALKPDLDQLVCLYGDPLKKGEGTNSVTVDDVRSRIFTFSLERPELCEKFTNELSKSLQEWYPSRAVKNFDKALLEDLDVTENYIASYMQTIENRGEAKETLRHLRETKPKRDASLFKGRNRVLESVQFAKTQTLSIINDGIDALVAVDNLESIIRGSFDDKDEAKEAFPALVTSLMDKKLSEMITPFAEEISKDVQRYIGKYDNIYTPDGCNSTISEFDATAAMLGGIAGVGSVGALSVWAATVAAGSNLGGYIAVAKIAAFLSSIGIPIGSGALISIISVTGGPVAWAIATGIIVGGFTFSLFRNWQSSMAKGMHKNLTNQKFRRRILDQVSEYWDDTRGAIEAGFDSIDHEFRAAVKRLDILANELSDEDIIKISQQAKDVSDFYAGIRATVDGWLQPGAE